ncbi:hypothetical protein CBJ55_004677 [Salmonella enterica subsp. enterica serovar Brancaster]|nr:hypothetical protein [Salmonella enterica subsp. enterica serovar Kingston]EDX8937686.1 hypothetical protein [Salmonella enterica subsp. enterica serovar Havana]EDX8951557.1 hypothetical protein [Salmonella enterica subsp. enterica serovar Brancaster]EDX8988614.1 hypothetical protein [Salmonella enterica subsp. enterica serovar Westhampton]
MPENPASYRVVRTKSYLFNKAFMIYQIYRHERIGSKKSAIPAHKNTR